jgi:cell division protein FtsZ
MSELAAVVKVMHTERCIFSRNSIQIDVNCMADNNNFLNIFELQLTFFPESKELSCKLLDDLKPGYILRVQGFYSIIRDHISLYNPTYERLNPDFEDLYFEDMIFLKLLEKGEIIPNTNVCIMGVGGFGGKVANRMSNTKREGTTTISVDTLEAHSSTTSVYTPGIIQMNTVAIDTIDIPINTSVVHVKIQAGSDQFLLPVDNTYCSLLDKTHEYKRLLAPHVKNTEAVIVVAGIGGSTGSVIAPVVADTLRKLGLFTIGIITTPFIFEGKENDSCVERAVLTLEKCTDVLITVPFERITGYSSLMLYSSIDNDQVLSMLWRSGADIIIRTVQCISNFLRPCHTFFDLPDIKNILRQTRISGMGYGEGTGIDCVCEAVKKLIDYPLMRPGLLKKAKTILLDIVVDPDITFGAIQSGITCLHEHAHPNVEIIWTVVYDDTLREKAQVTAIMLVGSD